jgi:hypothetical protein
MTDGVSTSGGAEQVKGHQRLLAFAQSLTAVVIFWAVLGGIGTLLLLPAMRGLIHGNFEGAAQKQVYALVGAAAAIAATVGPLLGGFITTCLSWRLVLGVVIIAVVLAVIKRVLDVPYTGPRTIDVVGALLSVLGMGGRLVLGILATGAIAMTALAYWLMRRKLAGKPLLAAGSELGLLVSQLNNYTVAPISEERVSETTGVNSAAGSFGLTAMAGRL